MTMVQRTTADRSMENVHFVLAGELAQLQRHVDISSVGSASPVLAHSSKGETNVPFADSPLPCNSSFVCTIMTECNEWGRDWVRNNNSGVLFAVECHTGCES